MYDSNFSGFVKKFQSGRRLICKVNLLIKDLNNFFYINKCTTQISCYKMDIMGFPIF